MPRRGRHWGNNATIRLVDNANAPEVYETEFAGADAVISSTSTEYDAAGRTVASTNADGETTRYEYDAAGRQTAVIDALGNRTEYEYDAAGRQVASVDPEGNRTQFEYDALGRRVKTVFPDNTFTTTTYDALGRRVAETDQAGVTRNFEYDQQGRLTAVVLPGVEDPETAEVVRPRYEYEYDDYGQLQVIRDPKGRETHFAYDHLGRQTSRTLPMGQTESKSYNDYGQLATETDFAGQTTEYDYDTFGRITDQYYFEAGATTAERRVRFVYDELGRQVQVIEGSGESVTPRPPEAIDRITENTYDQDGRLTRIASPEGTINYKYDSVTGRVWRGQSYFLSLLFSSFKDVFIFSNGDCCFIID